MTAVKTSGGSLAARLKRFEANNMTSLDQNEKRFDPKDATLKFVERPDDLDPYQGDESLRAEMSCGHAVTPESLTEWCRSLLEQGQFQFLCSALKDGTLTRCNKVWHYAEVRRLAALTPQEMQHFEEQMATLAAARYCEFKACPGCKTNVEREDLTNLNVQCPICTIDKEKTYQFCWQCLEPWKGRAPRSDRCDNEGCTNCDLQLLKSCKLVALPRVRGVTACPSIRACPTCGMKVEHDRTGCKMIDCPRCKRGFCFVCLKLTPECLKTSTHFIMCSSGIAIRQTSMPVWRRH